MLWAIVFAPTRCAPPPPPSTNNRGKSMDFAPGLRLVQRWWPIVIAVVVLTAVLAYAASFLITPTYSSSTRVLVRARDARFLTSTGEDLASRPGAIDTVPPRSLNQTLAGLATS